MASNDLEKYEELIARIKAEYPKYVEIIEDTERKVEYIKRNLIIQTKRQYVVTEKVLSNSF